MTSQVNQNDPYLEGYGDAYQGYGGAAPNFNRNYGEIKSPPTTNGAGKKGFSLPSIPLPAMNMNWLRNATAGDLNYHLVLCKTFYFFFFAAFGSLFPLIAVYFKQIGMNASQSGVLIGFRPFVEFFSAPFWGTLADKYKKWKQILLFSILSWIGFTLGLAFVQPRPHSCLMYNATHVILVPPWSAEAMSIDPDHPYDLRTGKIYSNHGKQKDIELDRSGNLDLTQPSKPYVDENNLKSKISTLKGLQRYPHIEIYGKSPLPLDHRVITNAGEKEVEGLVSPTFSSVVYRASDINAIFWLLLFLMMIGEFFCAPAITLADTATLGYLEQGDIERYGRQRMFGSLGWGLAMFMVGIALDHATVFADHPCGYRQKVERNYMVCFAVFTVLMTAAFLAATKFKFKDGDEFNTESIKLRHLKEVKDKLVGKVKDFYDAKKGFDKQPMSEGEGDRGPPIYNGDGLDQHGKKIEIKLDSDQANMVTDVVEEEAEPTTVVTRPTPFVPRGQPGQSGRLPEFIAVLRHFGNVRIGSMLFLTWFMGFGVGLVFTFLFWHLQDLHGTPTLFGIASVINHVSEILAYFFSKKLINTIGHVKVLYLGLLGNVARFLYISYLRHPWSVLPFELLQGLTHAAVWAACCSYITLSTPAAQRATAQGILQGVHHGLGRGCGAVIGGVLVYFYGTENVFRGYAVTCLIVFAGYLALNYFYIRKLPPDVAQQEDTKEFYEEGLHLAPCGVPMGMNRNLSSSKLEDMVAESKSAQLSDIREDPHYSYGSDHLGGSVVMPAAPRAHKDTYLHQPQSSQEYQSYGYDIR